jgi:LemA protein
MTIVSTMNGRPSRRGLGMDILVLIGALAVVALVAIALFNSIIGKKNRVEFAFASIDAQLKKRYDLIPNLVSSCEKYMGYEQQLLKDLTETRSKVLQGSDDDKIALDGKLSSQLRSVFALAENYPDLKAAENFTLLERSLNEVEEQLAASRRAFNAAVTDYNNAVQMFPTSIAAAIMGCRTRAWFEAAPEEREPVKVWR